MRRSERTNISELGIAALLVAILIGTYDREGEQLNAVDPILRISGIDSVYVLGETIAFNISLSNPNSEPMTVIPFTEDFVRNAMNLTVSVQRPDGQKFKLLAATNRSMPVTIDSTQVTKLPQNGSSTLRTQWGTDSPWERGLWHVFSEHEWLAFQRERHYTVNSDVLGHCFNQRGEYKIRFRLKVPSSVWLERPLPHGEPWMGVLESSELTISIVGDVKGEK